MFRNGVTTVQNHDQSLAVVGFLEGRDSTHQHVEDHPQRPDIWNTHTHTQKSQKFALNSK